MLVEHGRRESRREEGKKRDDRRGEIMNKSTVSKHGMQREENDGWEKVFLYQGPKNKLFLFLKVLENKRDLIPFPSLIWLCP